MIRHFGFFLVALLSPAVEAEESLQEKNQVLDLLEEELLVHFEVLADQDPPAYFLSYSVNEAIGLSVSANGGRLGESRSHHERVVDADLRVGSMALDNLHVQPGVWKRPQSASADLPLDGDMDASKRILWRLTDDAYREASKQFTRIQAQQKVAVEQEDNSPDFSEAPALQSVEEFVDPDWDEVFFRDYVKSLSRAFEPYDALLSSRVVLDVEQRRRHFVSSEGARIQTQHEMHRVSFSAELRADDGAVIRLYDAADAHSFEGLPSAEALEESIEALIERVFLLRDAPKLEPFRGPVVLGGRAAGVFFHEVLGHRIEGHRQKDAEEGHTFRSRVGQLILPTYLSVVDDPSVMERDGVDLMGHYRFDDEGVASEPVVIVNDGVFQSFLMSRSPVAGFAHSNGHGRREPGNSPVSRQGNLMVVSSKNQSRAALREELLAEVQTQGLEFGLWVESIQGGFTLTGREAPNSFQVTPDYAWKIYADGRPDEIVRGVDLIGTPLVTFERILATGGDVEVFNGRCGAESGWVPVSASSPSILLSEAELQKKEQGHGLPPLLSPPNQGGGE